eukprot:3639767-Rhodomonas_salina.4
MDVGEAAEDQEVEQVKNLEQLLTASALPLLRLALTQRMVQSKRWKWGDFVWDESRSGSLFGANASVYGANAPFFGHNAPYGGNAFAYVLSFLPTVLSYVQTAPPFCAGKADFLSWQHRHCMLTPPLLGAVWGHRPLRGRGGHVMGERCEVQSAISLRAPYERSGTDIAGGTTPGEMKGVEDREEEKRKEGGRREGGERHRREEAERRRKEEEEVQRELKGALGREDERREEREEAT